MQRGAIYIERPIADGVRSCDTVGIPRGARIYALDIVDDVRGRAPPER